MKATEQNTSKSYLTTLWLSLFLGALGADRFYLGKWRSGLLKLLTLGGFSIWLIVDSVRIALGKAKDSKGKKLAGYKVNSVTVSISFIILLLLLAVTAVFEIYSPNNYSSTSTDVGHVNIGPGQAIFVSFIGFGLLVGWLLFLTFTVVDAYRRGDWLWVVINILSFFVGFGVLNIIYYSFIRNKADAFIV